MSDLEPEVVPVIAIVLTGFALGLAYLLVMILAGL